MSESSMSSEIELKPCPFCGNAPCRYEYMDHDGAFRYCVLCTSDCPLVECRAEADTQAAADAEWNCRTPPSSATPGDAVQAIMHEVFKYADVAAPLRGPPMTQDESLPVRRAAAAQDKVIRDMLYSLTATLVPHPSERASSEAGAYYLLEREHVDNPTRPLIELERGMEMDGKVIFTRKDTRPQPASDEVDPLWALRSDFPIPPNANVWLYDAMLDEVHAYRSGPDTSNVDGDYTHWMRMERAPLAPHLLPSAHTATKSSLPGTDAARAAQQQEAGNV